MAGQKTDERDIHLGRQIAEERKRAGLSQRKVAKEFGMSAAQLQKYEKGTNRISAIHLAVLSRLTGTPVSEFFAAVPLIDQTGADGFAEKPQDDFPQDESSAADPWSALAAVVARHVSDHFSEDSRKEFAAAVDTLNRELNR